MKKDLLRYQGNQVGTDKGVDRWARGNKVTNNQVVYRIWHDWWGLYLGHLLGRWVGGWVCVRNQGNLGGWSSAWSEVNNCRPPDVLSPSPS